MNKGSLLGAFFFILFSCVVILAQQTVITGKLLGSDGKPMIKGNVALLSQKISSKPIATVEANKDGSYQVNIDKGGLFFLVFAGVNHKYKILPLILEGEANNIKLDVQLPTNLYLLDSLDDKTAENFTLSLITQDQKSVDFRKQQDGTYLAEFTTNKDRIEYQIVDLNVEGNFLPGTQSEDYVYDGRFGYKSVITAKEGKATITLDPKKLLRAYTTFRVGVETKNTHIAESIKIYADFEEIYDNYNVFVASHAYRPSDEEMKAYIEERKKIETEKTSLIKSRINTEKDIFLKYLLLINYFNYTRATPDPEIIKTTLDQVPFNSILWSVRSSSFTNLLKACEVEKREQYFNRFLSENKDSHLKAFILFSRLNQAKTANNLEETEKYYEILTKDYGETAFARQAMILLKEVEKFNKIKPNKDVPEFSVTSLDDKNKVISNNSLKGKYYLIDFWATWCAPCVKEMDNLHKAYENFKGKNFEILSLSCDEKPETITKFRQDKWKMPWLNTIIGNSFDSEIANRFGIISIPRPILVDPQGKIIATDQKLLGDELDKTLTEILGKTK